MRRRAVETEAVALTRQLAELLEGARPTRRKAGHVRVDKLEVHRLVERLNSATGAPMRRDWRGRVSVSDTSPLLVAANETREAVARAPQLLFTDDVLLGSERAEHLATRLRQAAE
jgi:hypothetical protein